MKSKSLKSANIKLMFLLALFLVAITGYSQKGVGEKTGISSQQLKPELVNMEGVISEIKIGPCKYTTGKYLSGTHLMVQTQDSLVNVHLGPTLEISNLILANEGDLIRLIVFQTGKLSEQEYIAKSINIKGKNTMLRDKDLKPIWAGKTPRRQGRNRS